MKKRILALAFAGVLAAGSLMGCSGTEKTASTTEAAKTEGTDQAKASEDEEITLRFAWWGGD